MALAPPASSRTLYARAMVKVVRTILPSLLNSLDGFSRQYVFDHEFGSSRNRANPEEITPSCTRPSMFEAEENGIGRAASPA
jgi:hypothetical protein